MHVGLCLSDLHPHLYGDGSTSRTAAAVHFGGHYRLIDFTLSNMDNSGIHNVAMVLGSQYQSLINHIGAGRAWDLARSSGGITFFPPYPAGERPFHDIRDEPLQRALVYVERARSNHVLVTDCSSAYNLDFRLPLQQHEASGADVTALYVRQQPLDIDRPHTVAYQLGEEGAITGISANPTIGEEQNISMGAFIVRKDALLRLLANEGSCDVIRFSCSVLAGALKALKVRSWLYEGYYARVSSLETFFHYNMDMLDPRKREPLFNSGGRRINTGVRNSLPTKYGSEAKVRNSIVSNGCLIEGTVENCVIFRDVQVKPGAVVRNSILQRNTLVGSGAELNWIVTDHDVIISAERNLLGHRNHPVYIGIGKVV